MTVEKKSFGKLSDGSETFLYTLTNNTGSSVSITDFGATLVSIVVPDNTGKPTDVVLGYDTAGEYETAGSFFGASVGRYANRLSNSEFILNGEVYKLPSNHPGGHILHGGNENFGKKMWKAEIKESGVEFTLLSPDGDEAFPGNLSVSADYVWTDDNILSLTYSAVSDKDTIVNMTNHAYFNLAGHSGETGQKQILMLNASFTTPTDEYLIPTGEIAAVEGTPFDFRIPKQLEKDISVENTQLKYGNGYDHNFVINKKERGELERFATLMSITTGIRMDVATTQPAVQLYTDNGTKNRRGKGGVQYPGRQGVCLETQHFPDSMAHAHFPSPILKSGEKYSETTVFAFGLL